MPGCTSQRESLVGGAHALGGAFHVVVHRDHEVLALDQRDRTFGKAGHANFRPLKILKNADA